MSNIRIASLKEPVDAGDYLFRRIHQLGINSVHGVPGDYNLALLDYIPANGLHWVGNCNELNAAYAADGYARVKGMSALVTTFGVGELSAINGVAGSYSEYVPVIHVVGTPSTLTQSSGLVMHHTLGNGNFNTFVDMSREITCALVKLHDPTEIADQIDYAIRECWIKSRPVYIALPMDMVAAKVEGARLTHPIDLSFPHIDEEKEDYVVDVVLKYLHAAKNPVALVDACAIRHHATEETNEFLKKSGLPVFIAPMAKGGLDETLPTFCGVYAGNASLPEIRERVESADLVLSIGAIKSDLNTAGFTYRISQLNTIDFHSNYIRVRYSEYPDVRMNGVLKKVTERMGKLNIHPGPVPSNTIASEDRDLEADPTITHKYLWPRLGQWLQPKDVIVTETGTSNFGIWDTKFPEGVFAISQVLWGSIGYATGATQGAALAAKELGNRRTILFTGDGSFQMTGQEVSTMIRRKLNPILFILCNEGYTIERFVHGMDAEYNDIQPWRHTNLLATFGADAKASSSHQVRTKKELDTLLNDKTFASAPYIQLVEVYMPKKDAPRAMVASGEIGGKIH